ncbi:MAG: class I SAM-dependent methyltransferase [Acidithiobacillus sp.]|jgi:ubiquinone/menaquinone biosynthesis C-methylase UbiE|uniref:class I SAM-dependent methyltransferase n=1 Tax=Acidithiobacillus sp. TaxID=1872118 RepID=UPI0035606D1C
MIENNAFFKNNDYNSNTFAGKQLPNHWWSRVYEYHWALKFANENDICADMGCGTVHPFVFALADKCKFVTGVDSNSDIMKLPRKQNLKFLNQDIEKLTIDSESFDKIFCISVLEHINLDKINNVLYEFYRTLKKNGRLILTLDICLDKDRHKANDTWDSILLSQFFKFIEFTEFNFDGNVSTNAYNILKRDKENICIYHAVLVKK